MITKKLMHDIQSWLNSLYDFKNKDNNKNKHIISSLQNFGFRFIDVSIRIWSLDTNYILSKVEATYNKSIRSEKDFIEFKNEVNSTIDNNIKTAIEKSYYLPLSD